MQVVFHSLIPTIMAVISWISSVYVEDMEAGGLITSVIADAVRVANMNV